MSIIALVRALLEAITAFYQTSAIRERRLLRAELRAIRHEIDLAINAGDSARIAELQDDYADATKSLDTLLAAPKSAAA